MILSVWLRRVVLTVASVWLVGCFSAQEAQPEFPWSPAWPLSEDTYQLQSATGSVVSVRGIALASKAEPCGKLWRVSHDVPLLLQLAPSGPVEFLPAARVPGAIVERAAWRFAEVMGQQEERLQAPGANRDPAAYQGIRVHSVRKTRRQGPPVWLSMASRDEVVAVAVLDRHAETVLASATLQVPIRYRHKLSTLPVTSLEKEQALRWVIWGQGTAAADGKIPAFRAVLAVDLAVKPALSLLSSQRTDGAVCP